MRYSDLGNGRFQNPILFADYSDPDVIRVGDTFYMTASSFNYTPGLPILVSKDLVNWQLVNYALDNIPEERYGIPRHSEGVWAPAIRFHEGMFYIYYGMPDEGYFVVRTKDPLGKWENPVCILEGKGLIDPCPFWDEDGRAYVIHGYAKSRIGFKSILGIFEMSPDGLSAISEDHFVFDGNDPEHPAVTIEGPKVYKRDGFYYILAPAGGVRQGYQVALRSKNIFGPYEIRTVMHQGSTVINGPHQGGLVDTKSGQEWFIHFQDRGLYGRICHLQPVLWRDGWPVIGVNPDENGCGEPVYEMNKPVVPVGGALAAGTDEIAVLKGYGSTVVTDEIVALKRGVSTVGQDEQELSVCSAEQADAGRPVECGNMELQKTDESLKGATCLQASDDFRGGVIGLQWQWLGNHKDSFYGKTDSGNGLRLYALNPSGDREVTIWRSANVLTQKLIYPVFEAVIRLDASSLKDGERAGVCMTGGQYITAYIERDGEELFCKVAESEGGDADKREVVRQTLRLPDLCDNMDILRNEDRNRSGDGDRAVIDNESVCDESGAALKRALEDICFRMTFDCDADCDKRELYFQNVTCQDESRIPCLKMGITLGDGRHTALDVAYTPSDHTWVGAKIGIFALSSGRCGCEDPGTVGRSCEDGFDDGGAGYADFISVDVTEK